MTRSLRTTLRATALLGVAALAAGSLGLITTPAFADPGAGGTGSITVHKYEEMGKEMGPNDGSQLDLSGLTTNGLVAGFTACTIGGIDLAKASDWSRLKDLTVTAGNPTSTAPAVMEGANRLTLSCGSQQMTSALTFDTAFSGLTADRAYVVYESQAPKGSLKAAEPAIVTVPYPSATGSSWNYHPHIYPKNSIVGSGVTKSASSTFGRTKYTITAPIKPLAAGVTYDNFEIMDQLSKFLIYTGPTKVTLSNAAGITTTLVRGTDYELTGDQNVAQTKLEMKLSRPGLTLLEASIGGKLVLTFTADEDKAAPGFTLANWARTTINGVSTLGVGGRSAARAATPGGNGEDAGVVNPAEDHYALTHFQVYGTIAGSGVKTPLAGVGFQAHMLPNPAATSCPATEAEIYADPKWNEDLLGFDPEDVMSDSTGRAQMLPGTRATAGGAYCAYIKIIPNGYKASPGPIYMYLDADDLEFEVVLESVNITSGDLPALPLTGASTNVALIAAGTALLMGAGALALARRRGMTFAPFRSGQ